MGAPEVIAVLGAGHGGCAAAGDLTLRGFSVRLYSRNPERLRPLRERGGINVRGAREGFAPLKCLTTDIAEVLNGADMVMLVVPSIAHEHYAKLLAPLLKPDFPVFLNPGHTGGGLHFVHELRMAGYHEDLQTCETVTLTYIARMEGPVTVGIYSYVRHLRCGAFPGKYLERLLPLLKSLYPEVIPSSSVLETALSNMNAVFHPPGMLMNAGWIESTDGDFLFYKEGISEAVGHVVEAIDQERMGIARALEVPARSFLETFHDAGLTTGEALASGSISRACRESEPNRTIKSPPSLDDRYVHEDVGFGLVPMSALGRLAGVPTPTIDALIQLTEAATGIPYAESGLTLDKMGLAGMQPSELSVFMEQGRKA